MVRTKSYETKEEAAEAWNIWAGSVRQITQEEYNELNDKVSRDYPIKNNKLVLPDGEHAFGDLTISDDGVYESPWPKIYFIDYVHAEKGIYGSDDIFFIYKLRSRWRLIEKDHVKLKKCLKKLILNNDRNNDILNKQLQIWNEKLKDSGFPLFENNDLRGIDLTGLNISQNDNKKIYLRKVNLSYSECHLLTLNRANLYEVNMTGIKGVQIDLSGSTCHGAKFKGSFIPNSKFIRTDLAFCDFKNSILSLSNFNGANCYGCDFSSTMLLKSSFSYIEDINEKKKYFSDLKNVQWDKNTRFDEVEFNNFLKEQNIKLYKHLMEIRTHKKISQELLSSLEVKPGIFGISLDLKKLITTAKNIFSKGG